MKGLLFVFVGGGMGSICRFLLSKIEWQSVKTMFAGTLTANILACFVLGVLLHLQTKNQVNLGTYLLLATGFCGGFSTFSTFSAEVLRFIQLGQNGQAALYVCLSLILGVAAVFGGFKLMETLAL